MVTKTGVFYSNQSEHEIMRDLQDRDFRFQYAHTIHRAPLPHHVKHLQIEAKRFRSQDSGIWLSLPSPSPPPSSTLKLREWMTPPHYPPDRPLLREKTAREGLLVWSLPFSPRTTRGVGDRRSESQWEGPSLQETVSFLEVRLSHFTTAC